MKDYGFEVTARATVTVAIKVKIKSFDSFDSAKMLGVDAIRTFIKERFESAPICEWPHAVYSIEEIKATEIKGQWFESEKDDNDEVDE